MATGEAGEPVHERRLRLVLADLPRDQGRGALQAPAESTDRMKRDVLQVRVTARQQIRARLPSQILQTLGRHPHTRQRQRQPQPARIPLPELATDDLRLGRFHAASRGRAGNEDQGSDEDDRSRHKQCDQDEGFGRHGLVHSEGKGDARVRQVKGAVVRRDFVESITDQGHAAGC